MKSSGWPWLMADFVRQSLVTIDPAIWPQIIAGQDQEVLQDWAARGWPAIVRRPNCVDSGDAVPVGVPLPPSQGKARVALSVPRSAILSSSPPPLLSDAARAAPIDWQPTIAALLIALPTLRCFGSLAWQHLTGLAYISDTSDLDLFAECRNAAEADAVATALQAIAPTSRPGLDGELASPHGAAVQWREWGSGAAMVVVKSNDAQLECRENVFA